MMGRGMGGLLGEYIGIPNSSKYLIVKKILLKYEIFIKTDRF
jgi:hypothetical protein